MSTSVSSQNTLVQALSNQVNGISAQTAAAIAAATGPLSQAISSSVTSLTAQIASSISTQLSTQDSFSRAVDAQVNPPAPSGYPQSCRDLIENFNTSAASGMYNVQPIGQSAFRVYCDNDYYGGGELRLLPAQARLVSARTTHWGITTCTHAPFARDHSRFGSLLVLSLFLLYIPALIHAGWTMVAKINAGPFNQNTNPVLTQQTMYDMIANPVNDVNLQLMQDENVGVYPPSADQGP
jgi:hypothetical protein